MSSSSSIITKAAVYSLNAHSDAIRRISGVPYITHPIEVSIIVATMTDDPEVISAALLHDTVEDCEGVTIQDIEREFGHNISYLVAKLTEDDIQGNRNESWMARKKNKIESLRGIKDRNVKIILLADKLANLRSILNDYAQIGESIWDHFNSSGKKNQEWYYREMMVVTEELSDLNAWKEFSKLVEEVFGVNYKN